MSYDINYNKWANVAELITNGGKNESDHFDKVNKMVELIKNVESQKIKIVKRKLMRDKEYHMEEFNEKKNSMDVFGAGMATGRLNQIDDIIRFIEDIEDETN